MLCELRVRDFAIIDALDLEFAPGLNVLTGETGAGKSIIVDALTAALGADPELAAAFARLTPGRQRSYVIHLNAAKKPETRVARLAAFRGHILAGKGAQER